MKIYKLLTPPFKWNTIFIVHFKYLQNSIR